MPTTIILKLLCAGEILSNMKGFLLSISLFLIPLVPALAADARYDFENGLPAAVKVRGSGTTSLSQDRYKDGSTSLKFSWVGQSELMLIDPPAIKSSMTNPKNGLMMWVCNETPLKEAVRVSFKNPAGAEICGFDLNMDFKGWRAVWIMYRDMRAGTGYYGDIPENERVTDGAIMTVRPAPTQVSGSFYIDRLTFSTEPLHHQITPDMQIPDNNHFLSRRNMWHWARLWEWEQNPKPALSPAKIGTAAVCARLDAYYKEEMPSQGNYDALKFRPKLIRMFDDMHLERLSDGTVKGRPIVSNDEATASDIKIQQAFEVLYRYALDYNFTSDPKSLERFFLVGDHLLWQGLAFGSGMGTNHHYGYSIRGWSNALWLMRKELEKSGKMPEYLSALEYWSGLAECRVAYEDGRDEIIDSWNTLLIPKITAALLQPTEEGRYTYMEALTAWISSSMYFTPGTIGGIKSDGTAFHHGGHYPAYAVGAYSTLGSYLRIVVGTGFEPDAKALAALKKGLMAMRTYCNLYDWGIGISGRHPFGGRIPAKSVEAFGYLALAGDLTGSAKECDPELGGAYLAMKGDNKNIVSVLKKAGIKASDAPQGFFVYNYGAFGVHRRGGWMLTLKGFNTDVWGSEIYAKDNRFGRYQSYGSVQIINSGNPASAEASRYSEAGWDWNRMPGTTTIHLPFDKLENPLKGTLMEKNVNRFPGVSSLEGRNGVLAFTYIEKGRKNFCQGATATKSVFCFDNRIVFIGTGITNNSEYPTETTLFQQRLSDRSETLIADDRLVDGFPKAWRPEYPGMAVIEDLSGNAYIIKDSKDLVVSKAEQTSPDNTNKKIGKGDFATAYLNHGISPENASYEYLMLVEPTSRERVKCSKNLPYEVIQADDSAHVVRDSETGITAYISYKGYVSDKTRIKSIPAETIVMERLAADGTLIVSVCTPDLGISEKTYTTAEPSSKIIKEINVNGKNITAECVDGQPVEFRIK